MTEYAMAMKKHPNLNVRNVKRLIERIRGSMPMRLRMASGVKHNVRYFDLSSERNLLDFNMNRVLLEFDQSGYPFNFRHCGIAGCIAGFACVLNEEDRIAGMPKWLKFFMGTNITMRKMQKRRKKEYRDEVFAMSRFMGIDIMTSMELFYYCGHSADTDRDVQPRHAAKLLERLLETGDVDWNHAMGRKKNGDLTKEEERIRKREAEEIDMAKKASASA